MIDSQKEIERRLSSLRGLKLSAVNRAADMLTLGFGPLRPVTNFKGMVKHVGAWALHIQCPWRLEDAGHVVATNNDLRGSDEEAYATAHRLQGILLEPGDVAVEAVAVNKANGLVLALSRGLSLTIVPDCIDESEDWRFFAPCMDTSHLVIKGGQIAPESFE
jgi:hypothetical protein